MLADGEWEDWTDLDDRTRAVRGARLRLPPVFEGAVFLVEGSWRCSLNGEAMGNYPVIDAAKARIDWEVWNRLQHIRDAYRRLLDRRTSWEHGAGPAPAEKRNSTWQSQ